MSRDHPCVDSTEKQSRYSKVQPTRAADRQHTWAADTSKDVVQLGSKLHLMLVAVTTRAAAVTTRAAAVMTRAAAAYLVMLPERLAVRHGEERDADLREKATVEFINNLYTLRTRPCTCTCVFVCGGEDEN